MLPEPDPLPSSLGALCARHEQTPAVIICSRCGSYACPDCRRRARDGKDYCSACGPDRVPAERGERFTANLVDTFVVWLPLVAGAVLKAILFGEGDAGAFLVALGFLGSLGLLGLQGVRVQQTGQSIGKRMVGIRVLRSDGSPVSLGRVLFLRNIVPAFIGSFCGLFSLVDALLILAEDRRCVHDHIADTIVVKADD